jgi:hypothetical protein
MRAFTLVLVFEAAGNYSLYFQEIKSYYEQISFCLCTYHKCLERYYEAAFRPYSYGLMPLWYRIIVFDVDVKRFG